MSLFQTQFPRSACSRHIRISINNCWALPFLCGALGIFLFALASPAADEVLNNASVIELQGLGLGDPVIIGKIKTSKCNFDTSINGLKELKAAKVSSPVIEAMLATKSTTVTAAAAAPAVNGDVNDPLAMHAGGVWTLQEVDGKKAMTRIEFFRPIMANKVGGYNPWTGMSHEQFVYLPAAKSKLELPDRRPVFYFYFVTGQQLASQGGSYEFLNAQSPEAFMLTRFQIRDGQRQLSISKGNAWYQSRGINTSLRGFEAEKVADGIYKVTFKKDLANGEYAFSSANGQGYGQCFPFGISSTNAWVVDKTISDPEVKRLCDTLKTGKPDEVIKSLKTLREMDAPEAVPQIVACLNNSNPNVIRDSCRTLAVLGDTSNVSSIEPLLKHSRADVRKDAQDAINALSGK
jgi:hypothetical protein